MGYQGYLIRVGDYTIPYKYMKAESYKTVSSVQDVDPYRDGDGVLHRNAVEHRINKVEFETPAMLTDRDVNDLMSAIRGSYVAESERKVLANIYVPEIGEYIEQEMYMADIDFSIYSAYSGELKYNSFRVAFVSY